MSLPSEVNYTKAVELPASTRCNSVTCVPSQGSGSFGAGQQITFPLLQGAGFIVPNSLVVSATIGYTVVGATAVNGFLGSCPATSWISRLDSQINSSSVENINSYNTLYSMLVNAKMTPADKLGLSKPFGLSFSTSDTVATTAPSLVNADGYLFAAGAGTNTLNVSAPLGCIFSSAQKFLPLAIGDCRITLTVDALANITFGADTLSNLTVSNVVLHYDTIEFDNVTQGLIMSQADAAGDLYFKSQSYAVSSSPIASGFVGQTEIPYAQSLTSIKSLYSLFTPNTGNRGFASYDATSQNGSLQYVVAGLPYPQTALDTKNRPQYSTIEFLGAINGTRDPIVGCRTSMSAQTWQVADADPSNDSKINVSKAYFGVNTEKLSSNAYMLSGISSMNSNLSVRIVNNTALLAGLNSVFIANYDAIIKYNVATRQVVVLK
jgi:hypothetical protein